MTREKRLLRKFEKLPTPIKHAVFALVEMLIAQKEVLAKKQESA